MRVWYDFHLHSCLSPCGDEEMTPCNLVNMAALLGYQMIALTDHNSCGNCAAAVEAGERAGITVVPGMELCTAEEIHLVCLFSTVEKAISFEKYVKESLPPVKNKAAVFGRQLYMDSEDGILGEEEILLVTASGISVEEARALVAPHGGFCYPAHIDRPSFSLLSSLGAIPQELGFCCAELTGRADKEELDQAHPILSAMHILDGSDAHSLEEMRDPVAMLQLPKNTAAELLAYLQGLSLKE